MSEKVYMVSIFGRPLVKQFALSYWTVVVSDMSVDLSVYPVCLSVTLVYCGQRVGWIKITLGVQVGLGGPGDTVLDADPASSSKSGTAPNFWPMSIAAKRLDGLRCHLVWR